MQKNSYVKALLVLTVLFVPMFLNAATVYCDTNDPNSWYKNIDGTLSTDYYFFYPYLRKDLDIGFSKFGEMIHSPIGATIKKGLLYDGRDPFAGWPDQRDWQNGWLIRITYTHADYGVRRIWAFALFSDKVVAGGDWNDLAYTGNPRGSPYGGRKTNGECVTDDIVTLYTTPRSEAYLLHTKIYDDFDGGETGHIPPTGLAAMPLVELFFTVEFNKVKKEVIVKKDVLLNAPYKDLGGDKKVYVDFSNRGEWDLGPSPSYASYAYFFTQGVYTTVTTEQFKAAPAYNHGGAQTDDTQANGFATKYVSTSTADCHYWHRPGYAEADKFDVAQVISSDNLYVGWAAYWPSLSYWSVYGWDFWFQALSEDASEAPWRDAVPGPITNVFDTNEVSDWCRRANIAGAGWHVAQAGELTAAPTTTETVTEPKIPYVIGEWSFGLAHTVTEANKLQFRGVTVYGVTDKNTAANDDTWPWANNVLDTETRFQLDEVFNPFDLLDVVHKQTSRQVEFFSGTAGGQTVFTLSQTPITLSNDQWDDYCSFAEWVEVGGTFVKRGAGAGKYTISGAVITFGTAPPYGTNNIKVLYSTAPVHEKITDFTTGGTITYPLNIRLDYASEVVTILGVFNKTDAMKKVEATAYSVADVVNPGDGYLDYLVFDGSPALTASQTYKIVYEVVLGSMEWVVVGKEAGTVDSVGAAFVSEAFDSLKNIDVKMSGMDILDSTHGPKSPYVFYRMTQGAGTRADWRDTVGRARLVDDFCTRYPVDSSNLVYVGGPLANLGSEYVNDFLPLSYGLSDQFRTVGSAYAGKIVAWNCWEFPTKKTWSNSDSTRYAVIAVYKDINGAVHLAIWGLTGDETYWAAYWFYHGASAPGIVQMQDLNPGVVGIVLKMTWTAGVTVPSFAIDWKQGVVSCKCPVQTDRTAP